MIRPRKTRTRSEAKYHEGGHRPEHAPCQDTLGRRSTCVERREMSRADYLRVALTYMLISMPHGTSTIFGAFQAILALLAKPDELSALLLKLACDEKFASKIFYCRTSVVFAALQTEDALGSPNRKGIKGFVGSFRNRESRRWRVAKAEHRIKNL